MIARALKGEIHAVRMSLDDAVDVVRASVVPALREQEGYGGMYLLLTTEGKALALSLWTTGEATEAWVVDSSPLRGSDRGVHRHLPSSARSRDVPGRPGRHARGANVTPNDVADRLRQLRAASDEAHRDHQKKIDSAIDELERKANELYTKF
jgi:heme-degrading monooxygenase HmoA